MGFTHGDLEELERALAKGARNVAFSDQLVTFASLEDMLRLRAIMKSERRLKMFGKLKRIFKVIVDIIIIGRQQNWWELEERRQGVQKRKRARLKFKKKHGFGPGRGA